MDLAEHQELVVLQEHQELAVLLDLQERQEHQGLV